MQTMELDRITEMDKFIQTYSNAIQKLGETMNQVENPKRLPTKRKIVFFV